MYFSKILALTTMALATSVVAAPTAESNAASGNKLVTRGFGCPDDIRCHNHCKSIEGYKGGYCKWQIICKCY